MIQSINTLEDFLGEEVVGSEGNPVGTLACYWERKQRNALLLGVDIPGRSGHTHIVPALGARCNERQIYVEVPFTRDKIVQAPCLPCECEVDETLEERIWAFYGMPAPRPVVSNLVSQKVEDLGEQLRRIVRSDTHPAHCATSPVTGTPRGDTPASLTEAHESKTQKPPDE
jgi:hypothetical protein